MKQTVIDILIYLFEHYGDDEIELDIDHDRVKTELRNAGFHGTEISKAFDWLEELATSSEQSLDTIAESATSVRVYSVAEEAKLDAECRGFLHFLAQIGVLDATNRELVIDRVMALDADEIDIGQLKWVILMVMFNRPGHEHTYLWMEELVMDDSYRCVH